MASFNYALNPLRLPARGNIPGQEDWAKLSAGERGRFGCIMVSHFTLPLINAAAEEGKKASKSLKARNGKLVLIDVWPFLPTAFDKSPPGSAWPHEKGKVVGPLLAYFLWDYEEDDEFWVETMQAVLTNLRKVALKEKCTTEDVPVYSNCSLGGTPVELIYRSNLEHLRKLRQVYDPKDVMGQAGGFKIPLPVAKDALIQ